MRIIKLNVGCGKRLLKNYVNIDVLQLNKHKGFLDGFDYIETDLRDIPFTDNSVDEILCEHVLEHFHYEEVYEILWEFHRLLKPEGKLHIILPNFEYWSNVINEYEGYPNVDIINANYAILCNTRNNQMSIHKSVFTYNITKNILEKSNFGDFTYPLLSSKKVIDIICKRDGSTTTTA